MVSFTYIGAYSNDARTMEMFGCVWAPGLEVEVSDPRFVAKLRGNRFFVEIAPDVASNPVSSDALGKPELIKMADDAGVSIDRRWSADRIRQAIMTAAAELSKDGI